MKLESSQAYPIRWVKLSCEHCGGRGWVVADMQDLINYLEYYYRGKKQVTKLALREYRNWRKEGTVDCKECLGAGAWEEPR